MKIENVYRIMLCLVSLMSVLIVDAQKIDEKQAYEVATMFMSRKTTGDISNTRSAQLATPVNYKGCLYIFNFDNNSGYIIVSADKRTLSPVLGYSLEGNLDTNSLPDNQRDILDGYVEEISMLDSRPIDNRQNKTRTLSSSVSPLLDKIAWGQSSPFNNMCPIINGKRAVTGCVATAMAQIMYYHRWPNQGRGSVTYLDYIEGEEITRMADFSQSVYQWDKMLPVYDSNSSEVSCNAVALLMHDCGYSTKMGYGAKSSGASTEYVLQSLCNHFDYDKSGMVMRRDYCTQELWDDILREEISAGRPVLYSGGGSRGGHAFVCDGYDAEGFFHFNYGWEGNSNGYFLTSATGFDNGQELLYGIEKNKGGSARISLFSLNDFSHISNDDISCALTIVSAVEQSPIELAIAAENTSTHKIEYDIKIKGESKMLQSGVLVSDYNSLTFTIDLPNGEYQLYPVCRIVGNDEWQKFSFASNRQQYIDLLVQDGKKTYKNSLIDTDIKQGTIEIDGIYYILSGNKATVTYRNDKYGSYKGTVIIPDEITVDGSTYQVDHIGTSAFRGCEKIEALTVGKNITQIFGDAFFQTSLDKIVFVEGSKLLTIQGWAFNGCSDLSEIVFPEGFVSIGECAFQGCYSLRKVVLPKTANSISRYAFNNCQNLSIYYNNPNPPTLSDHLSSSIQDINDWTLYVPQGCVEKYQSLQYWNDFGKILELVETGIASSTIKADNSLDVIYDLSGKKYGDLYKTKSKGIYIKKGKKFIVK